MYRRNHLNPRFQEKRSLLSKYHILWDLTEVKF